MTTTRSGLVIGAGVAGIEAALDLADKGFTVYLVEKSPSIGGHMAQFSKTYPTLDCSQCFLMPKMIDVGEHPNIRLLAYSEVKDIRREGKNFNVKIVRKPRYVDETKCTGCGACAQLCPVEVPNDFDERLGFRSAIYVQYPHAVPLLYTIDAENCLKCELCQNLCTVKAVNLQQRPEEIEINVEAIIVATGFDLFNARNQEEYGLDRYDNVITGLSLERLLYASGPTGGRVVRPSDGKIPKKVAFIQCVGPLDAKSGKPKCSVVCCMYAAKQAVLLKRHIWGVDVAIYHPDLQSHRTEGFEEFSRRAKDEFGVRFVKANVTRVLSNLSSDNLVVQATNIDSGERAEEEFDMVVLSAGIVPTTPSDFDKILPLRKDDDGFLVASDSQADKVTTDLEGVFLAGVAQGPKDISETISQAKAAAARAASLLGT